MVRIHMAGCEPEAIGTRLESIADFFTEPAFVIDVAGRVRVWNGALERMTGVLRQDILGHNERAHARVFYAESRPMLADRILEDGLPGEDDCDCIRHDDGSVSTEINVPNVKGLLNVRLSVRASLLRDENGRVLGALQTIRDVTGVRTGHVPVVEGHDAETRMERMLREKDRKIESLTRAMVSALESANYYNDEDTGDHIRRVSQYSALIAREAGFSDDFIRRIELYSSLHDIGKVGVPREILVKAGPFDKTEYTMMQKHVSIGRSLLDNPEIDPMARNIALCHHEHWDGTGYAQGLSGEAIPVEARIVAIADVFDALVSRRVYKPPFPLEYAMAEMLQERGRHFDPDLLDIFAVNRDLAYWIAIKMV